jgi:hypothetical protein
MFDLKSGKIRSYETLTRLGVQKEKIENKLAEMSTWSFAKAASRQVLASMVIQDAWIVNFAIGLPGDEASDYLLRCVSHGSICRTRLHNGLQLQAWDGLGCHKSLRPLDIANGTTLARGIPTCGRDTHGE